MNHLAIVGAGAAGTAALCSVVRRRNVDRVTLFDRRDPGNGAAFSSSHDWHLCNTSAGTMSIDPADPQAFVRWLQVRDQSLDGTSFVPRRMFGEYLRDEYRDALAEAAASGIQIGHVSKSVRSIAPAEHGRAMITVDDGETYFTDGAILATGAGSPRELPIGEGAGHDERYFASPYDAELDDFVRSGRADRVLVLGTNLSAVDAARTSLQGGSEVVMASPTGELPAVRTAITLNSPFPLGRQRFAELSRSPSTFRRGVVAHLDRASTDLGIPLMDQFSRDPSPIRRLHDEVMLAEGGLTLWQLAVGELLDLANDVWSRLPARRRAYLSAGCRTWIKRFVSSMPLENAVALSGAAQEGRLTVRRLPDQITRRPQGWQVSWDAHSTEYFSAVICAAGHRNPPWAWSSGGRLEPLGPSDEPLRPQADLRLPPPPAAGQGPRIFALGCISSGRYPVVNYMRTSAVQASRIASSIEPMVSRPG